MVRDIDKPKVYYKENDPADVAIKKFQEIISKPLKYKKIMERTR